MVRDDINLVVTLVGHAKLLVWGELTLEYILADGGDNRLFHCYL